MLEPSLTLLRASGFGAPNMLSTGSINAMGLGHAVRLSRLAEAYLRAGRRADEAVARGRRAVDHARKHKERANEEVGLRVLAPQVAI